MMKNFTFCFDDDACESFEGRNEYVKWIEDTLKSRGTHVKTAEWHIAAPANRYVCVVTPISADNINLDALAAIESELAYQKETAAKWNHQGVPSLESELLLLQAYTSDCITKWRSASCDDETTTLDFVRKVAGIAVRCMTNHGAIPRK